MIGALPLSFSVIAIGLIGCGTKTHQNEDGGSADDSGTPELIDLDEDGFDSTQDCNDDNPAINPSALEICDDVDNDCDQAVDEGLLNSYYIDADGDGYGDPTAGVVEACELGKGLVENADDCNDEDRGVSPEGVERCNEIDDDCDDDIDEPDAVDATPWYLDSDGDSWGDEESVTVACEAPALHVSTPGDCLDSDETVNPDADEICNDIDDDCDTRIDVEAIDQVTWYRDRDGDGWGTDEVVVIQCDSPAGYASVIGDCADTQAEVNPGADEICDLIDNDCDDSTGEDGKVTYRAPDDSVVDVTSYFSDGSYSSPEGWVLDTDGTFEFCAGTYYTYLSLEGDVTLRGLYGSDETILSGGDAYSILAVEAAGTEAVIEGFSLQDGSGSYYLDPGRTNGLGGGVFCATSATIELTDVQIRDSNAELGGGIYINGCSATLSEVQVSDTAALWGGGMAIVDGDAVVTDSSFFDNAAENSGGAFYADGTGSSVILSIASTVVDSNDATYGGALAVFEATFACVGESGVEAGFFDNGGSLGGAAFMEAPVSFRSTTCDWGDGSRDNTGDDLYVYPAENTFEYGDDATFNCNATACN